MKFHSRKIISSLLLVVTLITSILASSLSASPVKAQVDTCPPSSDPLCSGLGGAVYACHLDPILLLFVNPISPDPAVRVSQENICSNLIYQLARIIFAQTTPHPWYNPSIQEFQQKVFDNTNPDEIFGERYTYAQVNWILNSLFTMIFPPLLQAKDPIQLFTTVSSLVNSINSIRQIFLSPTSMNHTPPDLAFLNQYGAIGQTYFGLFQIGKISHYLPSLPSGVEETRKFASKLNIISSTFAQGTGYEKLSGTGSTQNGGNTSPVKALWLATRNMSLLIASLVIILAGFMVMFRTRISPQVSITIQMVIPRIVVSIILIIFSFSIAGFVIDLTFTSISIILAMIQFTQGIMGGYTIISDYTEAQRQLVGGGLDFIWQFLGVWIVISFILIIAAIVVAALANLATGGIVLLVSGMILGFFLWSIYVWARIMGQFIVAFISFNLLVVAGPLMIVFDILPSKESFGGFKKWIMCLIGNASVFVTYSVIAIIISISFYNNPVPGFEQVWTNGSGLGFFFNNQAAFPLFMMPNNIFAQYLVYVGFMSFAPNIVSSVKNLFCKSVDPSDFIERSVKDTMGQLTGAGQAVSKAKRDRANNQPKVVEAQQAAASGV